MGCTQSTTVNGIQSLSATASGFVGSVCTDHQRASPTKALRRVFETTDFHEDYEVLRRIGKGAFAHVYSVEHVESRKKVAAKVALVSKDPEDKEALLNEVSIMRKVKNCDYCVGASSAYMDSDLCYIIMDVADMSLSKALDKMDVTEKSLRGVFTDMLLGLRFIHGLGIVHRDVKPDNFLCDMLPVPNSVPCKVRLCDFGLSTRALADGQITGVFGTAPFMCPEMLKGSVYNDKADIWSLGVIVFVLLTGKFPYTPKEQTSSAMKQAIRNGSTPVFKPILPALQPSASAEEFGNALLRRVPATRPSARRALELAFVAPDPPLGTTCRINSLRTLVDSAKKLGALSVRDSRSQSAIDKKVSDKQAAAYREPKPATVDTRDVSVAMQSTSNELAGFAPSLDSLPSLVSCPRMWDTAASQQSEQDVTDAPGTVTSRPIGERPLATCKAETMGALPSMTLQHNAPSQMAAIHQHRHGGQKIGQGIKPVGPIKAAVPVKPVVPANPSAAFNVALQPCVPRNASAPAQSLAPALPATSAVRAQRKLADSQAQSMTVDVLPLITAPSLSRNDSIRQAYGQFKTADSLRSGDSGMESKSIDTLPSACGVVSFSDQSTKDSLPSVRFRCGEDQASTFDSLPSFPASAVGLGKHYQHAATASGTLMSKARGASHGAAAKTADVLPSVSQVHQIDEDALFTLDSLPSLGSRWELEPDDEEPCQPPPCSSFDAILLDRATD